MPVLWTGFMWQTAVLCGCRMTYNAHSCHNVDSLDETVQQLKEASNQESYQELAKLLLCVKLD